MALNSLKLLSLFTLGVGVILFIIGLVVYWVLPTETIWTTLLVLGGVLLMLGAILILTISLQYDRIPVYFSAQDKALAESVSAEQRLYRIAAD